MPRIIVSSASTWLAAGVASALRDVPAWDVRVGPADASADVQVTVEDEIELRAPSGAHARLDAQTSAPRLRAAVGAVLEGLSVRGVPWQPTLADHEPLTPRELEVFELMGKGLSNRDIGNALGISSHTAKYHVAQILAKVNAATRAEAVREGLRYGLIGL